VELRKNIRDELIIQTLLSRIAMEEGLDQTREVKMAFEAARRSILSRAWRQNWAQKNPVAENEIQKEYNASITSLGDTEYQIRQVVVADETAAYLILDQLDAGKSLGELAYKYTIESGGKKSKGLLPWVSPSLLLPPLGELVSKAKEGEILPTPVRTKAGWHVVQVEGVRNLKPPSFERLKSQVKQVILQRKMTQEIQQLLNEAEIEF
jgi:peptidyl-prolyl cis-trans isomerase C